LNAISFFLIYFGNFFSSLHEYVQAEKKKNNKTSSTKEGKLLSSSTFTDGKSTEVITFLHFKFYFSAKTCGDRNSQENKGRTVVVDGVLLFLFTFNLLLLLELK